MTIDLYPEIVKQQDLTPDHPGSEVDDLCERIRGATRGIGANKDKVIDALATQDATRRHQISLRYKALFGQDLDDLMKKEFSGDFGTALEFLALPMDQCEAAMLRKATAGIGSSKDIIWSITVGRTNEEINLLKKAYFKKYDKDLVQLLASELRGDLENLVLYCLQAAEEEFDPQFHTDERAQSDADIIHAKGQGRWGTNERGIFKILCAAPPQHLENISKFYTEKYGYTLAKAMELELGGEIRQAVVHMIGMKMKPYEAMAKLIREACAGMGTDELFLTCTIIRTQSVIQHVQEAHIEMYGKTIHERVRSETNGSYKKLLLQVLDATCPE